jgi:hypothetical protein
MANQFTQLFTPTVLGTTSGVIYTMPTSPTTTILRNGRVRLVNTSAATRTVTLYNDVTATASSSANSCLTGYSIAAGNFLDLDTPVLKAGETLRGLADATPGVTVHHIDGFLVTP